MNQHSPHRSAASALHSSDWKQPARVQKSQPSVPSHSDKRHVSPCERSELLVLKACIAGAGGGGHGQGQPGLSGGGAGQAQPSCASPAGGGSGLCGHHTHRSVHQPSPHSCPLFAAACKARLAHLVISQPHIQACHLSVKVSVNSC